LYGDVRKGSRDPFQVALAQAFAGAPSRKDWKKLAAEKPHLWANAIKTLSEPAGYVPRSLSVSVTAEAGDVAGELVRRFGSEGAKQMLEAAGLPLDLVSHIEPSETIEGESEHIEVEAEPDESA